LYIEVLPRRSFTIFDFQRGFQFHNGIKSPGPSLKFPWVLFCEVFDFWMNLDSLKYTPKMFHSAVVWVFVETCSRRFALKSSPDRLNLPLTDFVKPLRAIPLRSGEGEFLFSEQWDFSPWKSIFWYFGKYRFSLWGFLLFPKQKISSPF